MEDEIVITGMSGRFPDADNVMEYWEKLCNKVDFATEEGRRWPPGLFGVPKRMGLLRELDKFDNMYFGINHKTAQELDPQARILTEVVYESIVDAGYDPETLRGKNIGVFVGSCTTGNDSLVHAADDMEKFDGYALMGYSPSLFANRISYSFDFKGPSNMVDTACSSGGSALFLAVQSVLRGDCEAAIAASASIYLRPEHALAFLKLNMLSDEGKCKSFDANGDGYLRSEAVVSLFIQRSPEARRIYASIVNIKTNTDGFKQQGITYPSSEMQKRLMLDVLKESKLNSSNISYMEAHATGTKAGDPVEISAIDEVYCSGRNEPLLIGSVKSNIGHTEASSGPCGIVKVLLAMEKGLIPPNLHFNEPIAELKPLLDKHYLKVITELTPWDGSYAAINNFGFGGVNVNSILKRHQLTSKSKQEENNEVPQLVLYCGRTRKSVESVLKNPTLEKSQREFFALLHKLAYTSIKKMPYRGYKMLHTEEINEDIQLLSYDNRPIWYVFSGMGSQWPAMAKDLMRIETFRNSIRKSEEILNPYVPELMDILTKEVPSDNSVNKRRIVPAFVSIAAVQIALVDVLNELGLKPDGIVGHSVGELGCAYADGCITAKQMLLAAYWRGKATEDSDLILGSMVATGMTWSEAKSRCPKDIYPACHNAEKSVTISGPSSTMGCFINELKEQNISAREVNSCGYAFHCDYVLPIAEKLQTHMEKLIPDPKPRSSRWISSSYSENEWDVPEATTASASYFVHNLISPVMFCNAIRRIPKNAVVIEIGPHHLFQGILRREVGDNAIHVGLMKKNSDNVVNLLSSIGKMYTAGLNPDIEKLYSPVTFPVPRNTPMISPLIKWDHSETWLVHKWDVEVANSVTHHEIDPGRINSPHRYLLSHCIDGRILFPASGYIVLVWKMLAKIKCVEKMGVLPVAFKNIKILKATLLSKIASTKFTVQISKTTGAFEISESGNAVCTGFVSTATSDDEKFISNDITVHRLVLQLNDKDVYKELRLRGYEYGSDFRGIIAANLSGTEGVIKWDENWTVHLDTLLQFAMISVKERVLVLPIGIQSLIINGVKHNEYFQQKMKDSYGMPVKFNAKTGEIFSAGIYIKNVQTAFTKRRPISQTPVLEEYRFVPYSETCCLLEDSKNKVTDYISVCSHMSEKLINEFIKTEFDKQNAAYSQTGSDFAIDKYLQSNMNDYVLLKCLLNIQNNLKDLDKVQYVKECFKNYIDKFENDILHKGLLDEYILRTVLDVVIENSISKDLKIFEIAEGCRTICEKLDEYITIPSMLKIRYSILHPKEGILNKDHLPENTQVIPYKCNSCFDFNGVDLFILYYLKNAFESFADTLKNAIACLKDEGFILVLVKSKLVESELHLENITTLSVPHIPEDKLEPLFKDMNLSIISKKTDAYTSTLYLLKKCATLDYKESFININCGSNTSWVDELKRKMKELEDIESHFKDVQVFIPVLWLICEGSAHSGIIGLVNCLRQEPGGTSIRCVFIGKKTAGIPVFNWNSPFYKDQLEKRLVMNVYQNGAWGSYRHIRCKKDSSILKTENAYLDIQKIGDLSSLVWVNSSLKNVSSSDKGVHCYVYYASLNFKDVVIATGRVSLGAFSGSLATKEGVLGFEFSGRTSDGRRVMGMTQHKGMATSVIADPQLLWDVPDVWTLEEAASVPVVYATAYYALIMRGKLKKGERVLIHSGSGGVGQAAITIALSMGCDVYTTVGSKEKKDFLRMKFPKLKDDHISNSRDTSFEKDILTSTNGKGVHIVLNSLAEEKLFASLNCLAVNGRFLEIGMYDISQDSKIGMSLLQKNVNISGIFVDTLFNSAEEDLETNMELRQLVQNGINNGVVKPLNTTVFNYDEAEKAFRYMASGRHIGKVVLKVREEEKERKVNPSHITIDALKRIYFDPEKSYIVIGGLGGFALEMCQWMIERGAKNIVLSSRSGVTTGYQMLCLQRWKQLSINVVTTNLNSSKFVEGRSIMKMAAELGPIGGIFNLALVSRYGLMENQTVENYLDVCESKVEVTKNMDLLSREICPDLDFFVCFSSILCGRGAPGHSIYGYANSAMERICEERANDGLSVLVIQWGPIDDVGIISETMGFDVAIIGTVSQKIRSCLTVLEKFLQQRHPVVSSFIPQEVKESSNTFKKANLMEYIAEVFGMKTISMLNPEANLTELGMDSLIALELKNVLEIKFDIIMTLPEMRKLKIKHLKYLAEKSTIEELETDISPEVYFGIFYGNPDDLKKEDLFVSDIIVQMNTVTDGIPLFILHPAEGSVAALKPLAKLLPCPVYGIQNTMESPRDSVENLASWYWKHIKALGIPTATINLAGYCFGAMIGFEMALQAQQHPEEYPEIKHFILMEGSPDFSSSYYRSFASSVEEMLLNVKIQVAALFYLGQLFLQKMDKKELLLLNSYEERLQYTIDKIVAAYPGIRSEDLHTKHDQYADFIQMCFSYRPKYKLKRDVYLIKSSQTLFMATGLSDTYNLENVCEGKITTYTVEGTHLSFILENIEENLVPIITNILEL